MKKNGFALLAMLWLLVALGAVTTAGLGNGRLAVATASNRHGLAKAWWAREACVEIVKARYAKLFAEGLRFDNDRLAERLLHGLRLDSVPLGAGVWCFARAEDAGSVVNVGRADRSILMCLIRDSALVQRMTEAQVIGGGAALSRVEEESFLRLVPARRFLGDLGSGQINVNTAPIEVLRCLPGLSEAAARQIVAARRRLDGFESLAAMVAAVPPDIAFEISRRFAELSGVAVTRPPQVIVTVIGVAAARRPLRARLRLVCLSGGGAELLILGREVE